VNSEVRRRTSGGFVENILLEQKGLNQGLFLGRLPPRLYFAFLFLWNLLDFALRTGVH
jgi:hypothetical protein